MTRPGETVEQITVPRGDPDALAAAAGSLRGVAAQLQDASGQVGASPSLMSSWCGPGSSQFALLTGQEAVSLQSASSSVLMAGISVQIGADQLEEAQRKAQRAIVHARRARDEINDAKEAIREAGQAQMDAQGRMDAAVLAREAAEFHLFADAVTRCWAAAPPRPRSPPPTPPTARPSGTSRRPTGARRAPATG